MKGKLKESIKKLRNLFQKKGKIFLLALLVVFFLLDLVLFFNSQEGEKNQDLKGVSGQRNENQNSSQIGGNGSPSFDWENYSYSISDLGLDFESEGGKTEKENRLPIESSRKKLETRNQNKNFPVPDLPLIGEAVQESSKDPNREQQVFEYFKKNPGRMDGYLKDIQKSYEKDAKYPLINDYLVVLKDVFDGKRAWTPLYRGKSLEFFGEKKSEEIARKMKEVNQNKEERISKSNFGDINGLFSAIKQDTKNYLEKVAIDGFLDHVREINDYKYPLSEVHITQAGFFLEQAWVDQVYKVLLNGRQKRSSGFVARKFKTIEELENAIKKDTENYKEKFLRDQWLGIMREVYKNHSDPNIIDGAELAFESYHIEAIKKFLKENGR